jgi:hypothetical protein
MKDVIEMPPREQAKSNLAWSQAVWLPESNSPTA